MHRKAKDKRERKRKKAKKIFSALLSPRPPAGNDVFGDSDWLTLKHVEVENLPTSFN
jgi:hypothetical protein